MTTALSRRSGAPPFALAATVALALSAAACASTTPPNDPTCPNHQGDINRAATGKMIGYALIPGTIQYHFIDVRTDTIEYTWDTSRVYAGLACLRFAATDSLHVSPSGAFQFLMSGTNGEYLSRHLVTGGVTTNDTTIGYVFSSCEGTGGTFTLKSDSSFALSWADGQQTLILGPTGLHQLKGDTIWSSISVSTHADSLRGSWRFAWLRGFCQLGR